MTKTITRLTFIKKIVEFERGIPFVIINQNQIRLLKCSYMRPTISLPTLTFRNEANLVFGCVAH